MHEPVLVYEPESETNEKQNEKKRKEKNREPRSFIQVASQFGNFDPFRQVFYGIEISRRILFFLPTNI